MNITPKQRRVMLLHNVMWPIETAYEIKRLESQSTLSSKDKLYLDKLYSKQSQINFWDMMSKSKARA
jgi:hypothetical protein